MVLQTFGIASKLDAKPLELHMGISQMEMFSSSKSGINIYNFINVQT
jgi:hypothetical protein